MLKNLLGYKLILASNSPRRKELLAGLGVDFSVKTLEDIDESYPTELPITEVAEFLAKQKADAHRNLISEDELVLTADTIVCVRNKVLGKPANRAEALSMLDFLSGRSHFVYTGVCLTSSKVQHSFTAKTKVFFSDLSSTEKNFYVDTYKPFDKAGAYGVQEWIGYIGVERIEGSYYNVMGLPVHKLYNALRKFPKRV